MTRYTQQGFGDMCQADEPEDTRPVCAHCVISAMCAHGEVKKQILLWFNIGYTPERIKTLMHTHGWFAQMTDSTVNRWKAAISARYEQNAAILRQAAELENYYDGY